MKYFFGIILVIHGVIHLPGFLKEWKLAPIKELSDASSSLGRNGALALGLCWLIACLMFIITAVTLVIGKASWWIPGIIAVILSQIMIISYWKDAKWGTFVNLLILTGAIIGYAQWNFNVMVKSEVTRMYNSISDQQGVVISQDMLRGLPAPVQLWLTNSGIVGKRQVQTLRLKQKGLIRTTPDQKKWSPMNAEQYFVTEVPGFIWTAKMDMIPFIPIMARDKYIDGKGEMKVRILAVVPVANSGGAQVDQATLQRYLAEICWFPSAALSSYIAWEAIDSASAKATLTFNSVSGSAIFQFNENGDITSCQADRYMETGKGASRERWEVRNTNYGVMDGIRIPVKSEATWKLKNGDFTWLKLEITQIEYNRKVLY